MKILIKENQSFGGYIGRVVNDNLISIGLIFPLLGNIKYSNKDKNKVIELCNRDAKKIFKLDYDLVVVDQSK